MNFRYRYYTTPVQEYTSMDTRSLAGYPETYSGDRLVVGGALSRKSNASRVDGQITLCIEREHRNQESLLNYGNLYLTDAHSKD